MNRTFPARPRPLEYSTALAGASVSTFPHTRGKDDQLADGRRVADTEQHVSA